MYAHQQPDEVRKLGASILGDEKTSPKASQAHPEFIKLRPVIILSDEHLSLHWLYLNLLSLRIGVLGFLAS